MMKMRTCPFLPLLSVSNRKRLNESRVNKREHSCSNTNTQTLPVHKALFKHCYMILFMSPVASSWHQRKDLTLLSQGFIAKHPQPTPLTTQSHCVVINKLQIYDTAHLCSMWNTLNSKCIGNNFNSTNLIYYLIKVFHPFHPAASCLNVF